MMIKPENDASSTNNNNHSNQPALSSTTGLRIAGMSRSEKPLYPDDNNLTCAESSPVNHEDLAQLLSSDLDPELVHLIETAEIESSASHDVRIDCEFSNDSSTSSSSPSGSPQSSLHSANHQVLTTADSVVSSTHIIDQQPSFLLSGGGGDGQFVYPAPLMQSLQQLNRQIIREKQNNAVMANNTASNMLKKRRHSEYSPSAFGEFFSNLSRFQAARASRRNSIQDVFLSSAPELSPTFSLLTPAFGDRRSAPCTSGGVYPTLSSDYLSSNVAVGSASSSGSSAATAVPSESPYSPNVETFFRPVEGNGCISHFINNFTSNNTTTTTTQNPILSSLNTINTTSLVSRVRNRPSTRKQQVKPQTTQDPPAASENSSQIETSRNEKRPFNCETCGMRFSRNHDLKRHERIHSGIRPFICEHCGKSFLRLDALNRHLKVDNGRGCRSRVKKNQVSPFFKYPMQQSLANTEQSNKLLNEEMPAH